MILEVQRTVSCLDSSCVLLLSIHNLDLVVIAFLDVQVLGSNQELRNTKCSQGKGITEDIGAFSIDYTNISM